MDSIFNSSEFTREDMEVYVDKKTSAIYKTMLTRRVPILRRETSISYRIGLNNREHSVRVDVYIFPLEYSIKEINNLLTKTRYDNIRKDKWANLLDVLNKIKNDRSKLC